MYLISTMWMPVGIKKIWRDPGSGEPKWEWRPTSENPYAETSDPFGPLRRSMRRGEILMAQRKIDDWHYELVVKAASV